LRSEAEQKVLRNGFKRCGPGSGESRKERSMIGSRPTHLQVLATERSSLTYWEKL
jgi:hypothetical protein